jgi:hypothetical protein
MFQLIRSRTVVVLAVSGASLGVGIGVQGLAAGATSNCRTVYAEGTDTSDPPSSVVAHVCDRIVVDFVFGTQGQIVPVWNVSRRPAKKVVKFVSKGYGPFDDSTDEATYRFHFRSVGKGRTSVKFRETTPSPGYGTLDSWTVKITVLPRRTGGTGPTGPTGPSGPTGTSG